MNCPNCGFKHPAVIVYGHCVDENENEYPFNYRIYESGSSLPSWGVDSEYGYDEWPTRFCWKCRARFFYVPENLAMGVTYDEGLIISKALYPKDMPMKCMVRKEHEKLVSSIYNK